MDQSKDAEDYRKLLLDWADGKTPNQDGSVCKGHRLEVTTLDANGNIITLTGADALPEIFKDEQTFKDCLSNNCKPCDLK